MDVTVSGLRQHGGRACQQSVSGINLIRGVARDHEERHAVAHLGGPLSLFVEARLDRRSGRIVPDQTIAAISHHKRNAHRRAAGRCVVMAAIHGVSAMIQIAFLILTQPVVMLVLGRRKSRAHLVERRIGRAPVVHHAGIAVFVIGNRHRPVLQIGQHLAAWSGNGNVRPRSRPVEVLRNIHLRRQRRARLPRLQRHHQARRPVNVALPRPSRRGRMRHESVPRRGCGRLLQQAERHADDVRCVRFKDDGAAAAVHHHGLRRRMPNQHRDRHARRANQMFHICTRSKPTLAGLPGS